MICLKELSAELAQQCGARGDPATADLTGAFDFTPGQQVMGPASVAADDGADFGGVPHEITAAFKGSKVSLVGTRFRF